MSNCFYEVATTSASPLTRDRAYYIDLVNEYLSKDQDFFVRDGFFVAPDKKDSFKYCVYKTSGGFFKSAALVATVAKKF